MAKRKQKKTKKRNDTVGRFLRPTEAREAHNDFESAGAAVRVVPPINTLLKTGKLTQRQWEALDHYRTQAQKAEDDMAESGSLDPEKIMGGGSNPTGGKLPVSLLATPAILETARIERDLGSLLLQHRASYSCIKS